MSDFFWTHEFLHDCLKGSWLVPPDTKLWNPKKVAVNAVKRVNPKFRRSDISILRKNKDVVKALEELQVGSSLSGCIIVSDEYENKVPKLQSLRLPIYMVSDEIDVLERMASYRRSFFSGEVVCVTGTAGKTTTRDLLYKIFEEQRTTYQNRKNWNFKDHVFEDMASLPTDADVLLLELGMGQKNIVISDMTKVLKPTASILTSLGVGHLNALSNFSSEKSSDDESGLNDVLEAKLGVFEHLVGSSLAFMSSSIPLFDKAIDKVSVLTKNIFTAGESEKDDFRLSSYCWNEGRNFVSIESKVRSFDVKFLCPGKPVALNSTMALLVASKMGLCLDRGIASISDFNTREGRSKLIKMNSVTGHEVLVFDDSRNSTPVSLFEAFSTVSAISQEKEKIAVLGEVGEFHVGGDMESFHKKLGQRIIDENFSAVFLMGDAMRHVLNEMPKSDNVKLFDSPDALVDCLLDRINSDSCIMVKASAHMKFDYIVKRFCEEFK